MNLWGNGWVRGRGCRPRVEGGGMTRITFPPHPPSHDALRAMHPSLLTSRYQHIYRRDARGGRRTWKPRGRVGERGRIMKRDPMFGQPWGSPEACNAPTSIPLALSTHAKTPPALSTPAKTSPGLSSPAKTSAALHTPPQSPSSASFTAFIQQEMKTLQDSSPLHTVLSMDSFWSPKATHTPEEHPPGSPRGCRTPPAALLSPWRGAGAVTFSPSMFTVQASVLADGPLLPDDYHPLYCL